MAPVNVTDSLPRIELEQTEIIQEHPKNNNDEEAKEEENV